MSHALPSGCPVDDVIVAPSAAGPASLEGRLAEREAFLALSQTLAQNPAALPQRLADAAMRVTGAGSAGISLEDSTGGEPVFRWIATAGEMARYLNGTMPRHSSPCGTVLDRGRTLVMRDPVNCFEQIAELHVPLRHVLLVPFGRRGKLLGTVWAISHESGDHFTTQDVKTVEGLALFSTSILDALDNGARH